MRGLSAARFTSVEMTARDGDLLFGASLCDVARGEMRGFLGFASE